jgi:hypothetical protein
MFRVTRLLSDVFCHPEKLFHHRDTEGTEFYYLLRLRRIIKIIIFFSVPLWRIAFYQ